ncbi:MAG TPA: GNAT family N-acetyltransferase [Gemmatimonadales bacterium]
MSVATIRRAMESDVPLILQLIRELAEYERLAHEVVATERDLHDSLFSVHPQAEVVIAEVDGSAAGYALYFHNYSTFLCKRGLYLEDLFVRPPYRGRGVGKQLLQYLARLAVERGCVRFEWAVLDWNQPAIDFYRALGAVRLDDWRVFRVTGGALRTLAGIGS